MRTVDFKVVEVDPSPYCVSEQIHGGFSVWDVLIDALDRLLLLKLYGSVGFPARKEMLTLF